MRSLDHEGGFAIALLLLCMSCGNRERSEPVEPTRPTEEVAEAPPEPQPEPTPPAPAAEPPPPVLAGTLEGIAPRDDPSFDQDPMFHALMIAGEPLRRPSGRRVGWMWAHAGPWSLVPIEVIPSPYEKVTVVRENGTLCELPITRVRRFWASKEDYSLGGVPLSSFTAFEIEPNACAGGFGFVGGEIHEISIRHERLRPAPPRLRRRIEPYDMADPNWPVEGWDGTVRALRLPRYEFVLISAQSLFLLHGTDLSYATGLDRIYEADGRGLFLVWESPSESWIENAETSLSRARPLGPEDRVPTPP